MNQLWAVWRKQAFWLAILVVCVVSSAVMAAEKSEPDILGTAEHMRASYRKMIPRAGLPDEVANVSTYRIPADAPQREIPVRVYTPKLPETHLESLPIFLFAHGGGFVSGDLDTHDALLRAIANGAQCLVVSVDYRLAPEHPFPAGLEDLYAVLLWLTQQAGTVGGDSSRIVVGGDSAGGNLAAALCLLSRDRNGPPLLGQWLMYPTLSNDMETASWVKLKDAYFPSRKVNETIIAAYVPEGENPHSPLVAPLWDSLENVPPALLQVGELDPLQDDSKAFAEKLQTNGIAAAFHLYPGYQHGFLQFYQDEESFPGAGEALATGTAWLRNILYQQQTR